MHPPTRRDRGRGSDADRLRRRASAFRPLTAEAGVMATTTATAGRDVTAELAYLTRALKAPALREVRGPAGRAGPGRGLDPRGVPGRLPATRGRRPRLPRRRGPDPGRPVPGPQEPGGVRLRPRPRPETRPDRPPRHPGLRHRQRERDLPRPARHRQDPPRHRARDPRLPSRAPGAVRHRQPMGRPARRRPHGRPAASRAGPARPLPAARDRPMPTPRLCRGGGRGRFAGTASRGSGCRHSYRLSRNARVLSAGR